MRNNENDFVLSRGLVPYLSMAILIAAADLLFSLLYPLGESWIRLCMACGVTVCVFAALFVHIKKKSNSEETILLLIIFAGLIMRIGYMLYTPYYYYEHDVGEFGESGHADYILTLFSTARLPQTNTYQFYHPPLAHILMALATKGASLLFPNLPFAALLEAAQIVPCFASCALLLVTRSLCRELGLSFRASLWTLAVVAVQPTFYLFSSSINNDSLMVFFYIAAVLYTIRWYHAPTMKNILLLAVSIGLGMMTKLSAASIAFFTAPVFLVLLIKRWNERSHLHLFSQFAAFGAVCVPLGLWYPIRNLIKFRQPLGYVFPISVDSDYYTGWASISQRFLSFPIQRYFSPVYCNTLDDFNVWVFAAKSSVFGEYEFYRSYTLARLLLLSNLILIALSLAAMIAILIRGKKIDPFARFGLFGLWLLQIGFFVLFNIQYPFGCTMDFRYIVPTAIVGALYLAICLDRWKSRNTRAGNAAYILGVCAISAFALLSVFFFSIQYA